MSSKVSIFATTLFLLVLSGSIKATPGGDNPIGDITASSGEIYVRSGGIWKRFNKGLTRIYNADKIVAVKGRAEITLRDGGIFRLDTGTNVRIFKNQNKGDGSQLGSAVSPNGYQVNVVKGRLSFDSVSRGNSGKSIVLKTPVMKAEYVAAVGDLIVDSDGETRLGLMGDPNSLRTEGNFQRIENVRIMDRNEVFSGNYKLTEYELNSPYLKAPITATIAAEKSEKALIWANASQKVSKIKFNDFLKNQNSQSIKEAAFSLSKNSQARYDFAYALAGAAIASIEESQLEANVVSDNRALATEIYSQSGKLIEEISDISSQVRSLSLNKVNTDSYYQYLLSSASSTLAERSVMLADKIGIIDSKLQLVMTEDDSFINSINALIVKSERVVSRSQKVNSINDKLLKDFRPSGGSELSNKTIMFAAHTMMNVARVASSCTTSLYEASPKIIANDLSGASFGDATNCQLSETAQTESEVISRAIATGNQTEVYAALVKTQEILKSINQEDREYEETYLLVSRDVDARREEVSEELAAEMTVPYNVETVDLPVDPMDLSSASNTK